MSKRKPRRPAGASTKSDKPRPGQQQPAVRAAASRAAPDPTGRRPAWPALALLLGLLVVGGIGLAVWLWRPAPAATPPPTAASTATVGPVGGVDGCRAGPRFQSSLGLSNQAVLTTSLTDVKGLAILDPAANNGQGGIYQHESWDDAGFLGPFITDRRGHIYTAPVPLVSLVDNPPEQQNRIYRVDTDSQVMALYIELPWAQPPSGANPFGVVGLAYDCETDTLYATSLAGSTASQTLGRIFHIDLAEARVLAQADGIDAMGVGVFNGVKGKRLYFGLARAPEVHSIALDAQGNFVGEPRREFSFASHVVAGRRTVRRIRFGTEGVMTLHMIDFNFTLQVAGKRQEDVITYSYDPASDTWTFVKVEAAR